MSNEIILNADARLRTGTNKNREIRREDSMVPAVIYGNNEDTKNIKVPLNEITKACESELFYTQVLKIILDGNEEKVVLKELQREPEKGKLLHADFQRVSSKTKLKVTVPVKFINEEAIPGTGVNSEEFWEKFSKVVHELAPINKKLIEKREDIQKKIDSWHKKNKGKEVAKGIISILKNK